MISVKFASASALALAGTLLWAQAPGSFVTIDVPGAVSTTSAVGSDRLKINAQGQIVGGYTDTLGKTHGFLLSNGNFTTFDYPGAVYTTLNDISPGGDTLLGIYKDTSLMFHGFLLSRGNLSTIDVLGASTSNVVNCGVVGSGTQPLGLSPDGDVGGLLRYVRKWSRLCAQRWNLHSDRLPGLRFFFRARGECRADCGGRSQRWEGPCL